MKPAPAILLVEDEASIRRGIRLNLEAEGYQVREHDRAATVLEEGSDLADVALGILDVMLPGDVDGFELCRILRSRQYSFPVIFLTARAQLDDKLEGFEAGGDDYLTKPFELEELLARVAARLRRDSSQKDGVVIGDFLVQTSLLKARHRATGEEVLLGPREAGILQLLIEHRGGPVSRDEILDRVWGTAEFPSNRTIDNYILKFRRIFEPDPNRPVHFITRHGTGYELSN